MPENTKPRYELVPLQEPSLLDEGFLVRMLPDNHDTPRTMMHAIASVRWLMSRAGRAGNIQVATTKHDPHTGIAREFVLIFNPR